jgi:hydrogenase maturation factor
VCQAIAGRIDRISGEGVDDAARDISLALGPHAGLGEWVIFHSGYALRVVSAEEVTGLISLLEEG